MCGICGRLSYKKNLNENYYIIQKMLKALERRGPDEEGVYIDNKINLGYRKLGKYKSIKEYMPMKFRINDITYVIVFDGKIYNINEIKGELIDSGFSFDTISDAEVILKGYVSFGERICEKLNGVFSFGIWNDKEESLLLVRDHFGVKPLFFEITNDEFLFSSEIKGIIESK